jgi:hypothetical protein
MRLHYYWHISSLKAIGVRRGTRRKLHLPGYVHLESITVKLHEGRNDDVSKAGQESKSNLQLLFGWATSNFGIFQDFPMLKFGCILDSSLIPWAAILMSPF